MPRLTGDAAAALFVTTATASGRAFDADADAADIATLCELLEYWPPAIELAAHRTAALSLPDLIGALRDRPVAEVLDAPGRDPDRATVRADVVHSLDGLSATELGLAERLAGFVDWCTLAELSDAVPARVVGGLPGLVDRDLVDADRAAPETLFRLRRPHRELLEERGAGPGADHLAALRACARDASAALLIGLADDASAEHWHAVLARRERDLRAAAWRLAGDGAEATTAADPATGAGELVLALSMHGAEYGGLNADGGLLDLVVEGMDWDALGATGAPARLLLLLEAYRLRRRFESVDPGTDADAIAADLRALVDAAAELGDVDVSLECLSQSIGSARTIGHLDQARAHADQAIALATRHGRPIALAHFELLAAMIAHVEGRFDEAGRLAARAYSVARRHDLLLPAVQSALMFHQLPAGTANVPAIRPSAQDLALLVDRLPRRRSLLGPAYGVAAQCLLEHDPATAARTTAAGLRAAAAIGLPAGLGIGVMTTVVIAAVGGEPQLAARLHGAIADHAELVRRAIIGANRALYDATIEQVRAVLGDEAFARACGEGAAWSWARITKESLDFADATANPQPPEQTLLTPRQFEILVLLAAGMSNKEISERLVVAPKTTMHHTSNIYRRLGVRGRGEAVAWGRRAGLI
ncbi:LuxR C-terminal-related transcriptional regulator [Agromyces sp. H3Y2-19a]|uniref:LuxR C-terminal-related transcriptional regulator n=1 Tax=Agromyces TaxID=33877 RepID=UPI001E4FDFD2|nr:MULTISPECIES: LuxR C-terminal-related transcriptional regulator [Agromyces]MCD5345886.1 LuxR C-terminal-related transcriptional regulator [Agromyces sp. S2-1-8]MDF0512254.1 LuxR C-terminal-related transcriptional regulator [Agromyces chromiiresistens]